MQVLRSPRTKRVAHAVAGVAVTLLLVLTASVAAAQTSREQARFLHDRLVGVPPTATRLQEMADLIDAGLPEDAARLAMTHPVFYTTALKNFVTPWTNVEETVFADLNDFTATVIGLIRDDEPFDQVLYGDVVYVGAPGVVASGHSQTNNDHYRQLEADRVDLSNPALFRRETQSGQNGAQVGSGDAAGIITSRAAGEAFFSAGTNRRMWRFVSKNFLCRDLEDVKDTTRPVDRIRQDVSRSPGGDSSIFLNHCSGCHAGMDPLAAAFAYFEWDATAERVVFTPGSVQGKYLINSEAFPFGYVTVDDQWENRWREGPNAALGWGSGPDSGFGPQGLGREIAGSRVFAECQVEKVFAQVCFRPAESMNDYNEIQSIADDFEADYSMQDVFAEVAVYCSEN